MDDLGTAFEAHRTRLTAVAYRMLGSRAEAEDAVQEAWLRYAGLTPEDRAGIRDVSAWLATIVGRICLDVLRSARVRRTAYPGQWLPEPVVSRLPATTPDPAEQTVRTDDIGLALLVVLERLSPEQRIAFVLHDIFAVPFDEIATALGGTPAAARQLAARARRAVAQGAPRHNAGPAEQRRVVDAFLTASRTGDLAALLRVLAPDVVLIGDGGGLAPAARQPVTGAEQVARLLLGIFRRATKETSLVRAEPVLVNGVLGLLIEADYVQHAPAAAQDGRLRLVLGFAVADGRITAAFHQLNPAKLSRVPAIGPDAPPLHIGA